MTQESTPHTPVPTPTELLATYLQSQVALTAGDQPAPAVAEVELYEVTSYRPVDAKLAWAEAVVALRQGGVEPAARPVGWHQLTARLGERLDLPLCVGNYPQMVRDLSKLLQARSFAALIGRPATSQPVGIEPPAALVEWITAQLEAGTPAQQLTAVGCLRLLGQFERAKVWFADSADRLPESYRVVVANERAGLLWACGERDAAAAIWEGLAASGPVWFNRGLACLFRDQFTRAVTLFTHAAEQLPPSSGWHHLALFYRTLAGLPRD
jgi:hypothetical protein